MNNKNYHLYIDDTGTRTLSPDSQVRKDGMDCFGLGGFLIDENDTQELVDKHEQFCKKWKITTPLHSTKIRGKRKEFGFINSKPEFYTELSDMITSLPLICIGSFVHRPGYFDAYVHQHKEALWEMCKTSYSILIERAVKFCKSQQATVEVYFEGTGPKEDNLILGYTRALKQTGNIFNVQNSSKYEPLSAEDYQTVMTKTPKRQSKKSPLMQIADLVLYPMAKGGYDPNYPPYVSMSKQLIEEHSNNTISSKYFCFK